MAVRFSQKSLELGGRAATGRPRGRVCSGRGHLICSGCLWDRKRRNLERDKGRGPVDSEVP